MNPSPTVSDVAYYHTKIKEWPEQERPREKLLQSGAQALSDAELLALFIGSGTGGVTAVDVAKRLLIEYQNLGALASVGAAELGRMKGIGPARAARILAAFELGRRVQGRVCESRPRIKTPSDVAERYAPQLRDLKRETFRVLLLDSGNRIIRDMIVSEGTLNASLVHAREVFKPAIDYLAAGVILLHNHPSGQARPSQEDREITRQLVQSGRIMGIPVMDHIIIAGEGYYSFAESRLIDNETQ